MSPGDQSVRSAGFTVVGANVTFNAPRAWKTTVSAFCTAEQQAKHTDRLRSVNYVDILQ